MASLDMIGARISRTLLGNWARSQSWRSRDCCLLTGTKYTFPYLTVRLVVFGGMVELAEKNERSASNEFPWEARKDGEKQCGRRDFIVD